MMFDEDIKQSKIQKPKALIPWILFLYIDIDVLKGGKFNTEGITPMPTKAGYYAQNDCLREGQIS